MKDIAKQKISEPLKHKCAYPTSYRPVWNFDGPDTNHHNGPTSKPEPDRKIIDRGK